MTDFESWGLYPKAKAQIPYPMTDRFQGLPTQLVLPRGLGRSYGDSCLNQDGILLTTTALNHFISLDREQGLLRCEAGVSFAEILQLIVPHGFFLPVTPGTKFVTVGGAIANDIHGKNHHTAGNFGHHVLSFELLRSSGERLHCSRTENADFFYATLGGLGLTGLITWAEFSLKKISSAWIDQQQIQFHSLQEFFDLSKASETTHEFTVSWVDCVTRSKDIRGIFIRGNQALARSTPLPKDNFKLHSASTWKNIPTYFPEFVLNRFSIQAFNELYFRKNFSKHKSSRVHYEPFYYPLDSILNWNKIYGRRGFLQYQCVLPFKNDQGAALAEIFALLKQSQMGSFLAVLKTFGDIKSEGLLSFPQEGVTLALDFPNYGPSLLKVLEDCDRIVLLAGGRVYPAKDARMSAESFHAFFPSVNEFTKYVDPQFSSSFWRRVR